MGEARVKFFIQRLDSLLLQEAETFVGLDDQVKQLMTILREIGERCSREGDAAVHSWVNELRDLIISMDDNIDEFIIQMDNHNQNESDRMALTDCFRGELQKLVSSLVETLQRMTQLDDSTAMEAEKEEEKENSDQMEEGDVSSLAETLHRMTQLDDSTAMEEEKENSDELDDGETSDASISAFKLDYMNLPYFLQTCLKYCCIFPKDYWIHKGRLIRLLVAEGLIQEKAGKIMEEIAEENINELVSLGMLEIVDEHHGEGTKLTVPFPYHKFLLSKMEQENFVSASTNSDSTIPNTVRRVSIHLDMMNVKPNLSNLRLRSLFLFENQDTVQENSNWLNLSGSKFLRVLDLEGTKIESLPDEVGDLIHLRYLGLKQTNISELPERLGKLQSLQTLDIRWCGYLTALPDGILNIVRLRHLKMFKNICVAGMKVPVGIGRSKNLLTLTGVYAGGSIARELGNLNQLKRLGLMDVVEEDVSELFSSIMKMQDLLCLSLEAGHAFHIGSPFHRGTLAVSEAFSPPPFLTKLKLEGVLERMPNWLGSMERLTKLRLGFSCLNENPSLIIQFLPNLKHLTLWQALDAKQIGREFFRAGGFPKLEVLSIASSVLEEWTELEEGALPNLKYLHLHNCSRLRMLPEGLQFVTTLKQLDLLPLLDDHLERLQPDGGKENYKIKHIPMVSCMPVSRLNRLSRLGEPRDP